MFRMRRCSPTFLKLTTICDVSHVISSTRPSSPLFFPTREEGLRLDPTPKELDQRVKQQTGKSVLQPCSQQKRTCKIMQDCARILHARLAWHVHAICPFSCTILAQSCQEMVQNFARVAARIITCIFCKILWKPRRANIDVLNPDTKSEIPTRKMKSRHESEIPTRNPDMKSEIPTRNPDMKSEIPTRNPDMKSDCVILIRAHQNFLSRRPLPSQTVVVRCGN